MHVKRPFVIRSAATAILVSILCLIYAPAMHAQNAMGNGRALDANLQQGSNGSNPAAKTSNFSAGNDIITGNVTGLGYFHGNVGYGASGSFGGRLGSDDLFRFRARSLSSTPSQAAQGYTLGQGSVFRSHTNASVGDLQRTSGSASQYRSDGLIIRKSESHGTRSTKLATSSARLNDEYQDRIGYIRQPEGRMLEVTASPLLGVRHHQIDLTPEIVPPDQKSHDPQAHDSSDATDAKTTPRFYLPGVTLGQHLQDTMKSQSASETTLPADQLISDIESQLFQPIDKQDSQENPNAYRYLLAQIKQDRPDPESSSNQPNPEIEDPQSVPAQLKDPTLRQLAGAKARWRSARRRMTSQQGDNQDKGATSSQPLQKLLHTLDYDLPRIGTLAGKKDTLINQLLRKAQKQLQAQRYFDAQESFHHVVQLQPDDPMGQVGLLHAQIGAGLFRSAHVSLRSLFEKHPELIAARYDALLLPNDKRLTWINRELKKTLALTKQAESALILAYLGYQTGSPKIVTYALNIASVNMPHDPVVAMLRRIWIDAESVPDIAVPVDAQTNPPPITEPYSK